MKYIQITQNVTEGYEVSYTLTLNDDKGVIDSVVLEPVHLCFLTWSDSPEVIFLDAKREVDESNKE